LNDEMTIIRSRLQVAGCRLQVKPESRNGRLINTGLPAWWSGATNDPSRFNGFYKVREAVETAGASPDTLTPGWKPGVNERTLGVCKISGPYVIRLLFFIALLVVCASGVRAGDTGAEFDAANKLYEQAKYPEASAAYQKIIEAGQPSAAVYFNLGNAYFKAGQLGRAVAAYRQAEQLAPRDPDVRANIQFARDQAQGPTLTAGRWTRLFGRLSLNEWTVLAAAAVWVWLLLLGAGQLWPAARATLRGGLMAAGVAALVLCVCAAGAFYGAKFTRTAVIITSDAVVRHGPLDEAAEAFKVHDGAELQVLDEKDKWLQVSPGANRIGWVRRDQVLLAAGE
jgi:tetratricopeptide (TPR) repeat protein